MGGNRAHRRDRHRIRRVLPHRPGSVAGALPAEVGLGPDLSAVGSVWRHRLPRRRQGAHVIVETSGLTKRYGDHTALDGVDLAVPEGTVYGLVGPNGAGKTTLLGLLSGLRRPTAGQGRVAVPKRRMAVLPDTPQFDPWLTGREGLALALELVAPHLPSARIDQVLGDAGLTEAPG